MLGSIQLNLKHFILFSLLIFFYGCSSISVERFYAKSEKQSQGDKVETNPVIDNSALSAKDNSQAKLTTIPLVKDNNFPDEISLDEIKLVEASGNIETTSIQVESLKIDNQCPKQFHDVKIPENGKYCQSFAAELPASLVFFVAMQPSETVQFFIDKNQNFDVKKEVKNRIMLSNSDNSKTLIVSPDGVGSQVDILVKR